MLNSVLGIFWLQRILDSEFVLQDDYKYLSLGLIIVPLSIIVFVLIVAVKIICFYLAD